MIRLTSILLSALMLLQSMHLGVSDLLQLDEFIQHARYHQEEFGDSFLTFLSKHYGDLKDTHHHDQRDEQPDHEQLPFQQIPQLISGHTAFYVPGRLLWEHLPEQQETSTHNFYYHPCVPAVYPGGVFQPPRQA